MRQHAIARRSFAGVGTLAAVLLVVSPASAQDNGSTAIAPLPPSVNDRSLSTVPRLIQFSGTLKDASGNAVSGSLALTFSLYQLPEGGTPLWSETQNLAVDSRGRYSAYLGAASPNGLPLDLFSTGAARWLGVQPELPGVAEPSRVLLVGVPYALKAADADTLGGKPASAYVTTSGQSAGSATESAVASQVVSQAIATGAVAAAAQTQSQPAPLSVGGAGTTNYIPIWTNSTTLGNSTLFQTGGQVGIGNTSPAARLDVSGSATVRGTLTLPALGTATGSQGYNSQPGDWLASAYNSSSKAAVSQHFRWQAEPVGNDTSSPSGKFNLLFASGTGTPAETGLSISSKGIFTFASGQTFPGTGSGTVTSVGSGAGLTGGPITKSGSLSIATAGVTNAMLQHSSLTVSPGTDLTGGGAVSLGGSVTLNLDTTKVPQLNAANTFTANQSVTGNVSATGSVSAATLTGNGAGVTNVNASTLGGNSASAFAFVGGQNTFVPNQSFQGNGLNVVIGDVGCGSPTAGIGFGSVNCSTFELGFNSSQNDLYINRPSGGNIHFREANTEEEMLIAPGGAVTMTTGTSDAVGLGVTSSGGYGGTFYAGTDSAGIGSDGLIGVGGNTTASGYQGGDGVQGFPGQGPAGAGYAGFFGGNVDVSGNLSKGGGSFKIDHPLDPANKYLYHSFVESPDMKNVYDGVVTMDGNGEAVVEFADWFGALNRDFRYQLTCIGGFAPVYVAEEVNSNQFKIAGGKPGMKVSWQVTGIRQDAWANAHRIPVEEDKNAREQGFYIHPELYGAPPEKSIEWARHPELMKRRQEMREKAKQRDTAAPHRGQG